MPARPQLRMSRRAALWALVVLCRPPALPAECPLRVEFSSLDHYLRAEIEINAIPGLSVAAVGCGEILFTRAYGVRSLATGEAMQPETLVDLASVSKPLTALAVLQLHEAGGLDLDSPVQTYLPEFHLQDAAAGRPITVRHLLLQTSGLTRRADPLVPCCGKPGESDLPLAVRRLAGARLNRPVGLSFQYANSNYVLPAAIVERVSGVSFPAYMESRVFAPLGMTRTTLDAAKAESWGMAAYHEQQWGRIRPSSSKAAGWPGASQVKSNVKDMARYAMAMLQGGGNRFGSVIIPAALRESHQGSPYGLGWFVVPRSAFLNGARVLEHSGDIWGANAAVALAPERQLGVVILINAGVSRAGAIARGVLARLAGLPGPPPARRNWAESPDYWAICFVFVAGAIFCGLAVQLWRARIQFRLGQRRFELRNRGLAVARTGLLLGMSVYLLYTVVLRSFPLAITPPATLKVSLEILGPVVALLLATAGILGLAPLQQTASSGRPRAERRA